MTQRRSFLVLFSLLALVLALVVPACAPGDDGSSRFGASDDATCTVDTNDDGSATITCPDGSKATLRAPAGEPGPPGPNGEPAPSPPPVVTATTDEPPGKRCPYGGTRIDTGADTNGDDVLQPKEVTGTAYACDGEPGEGAKPTCDVLEGDLAIESSADVDTFALLGCRRVTGNVAVSPRADLSSLDGLASLEEVDGDLQIPPCGDPNGTQACSRRLDIAGLVNLRRVGGAFYIGRDVVEIPFWEITELGGLTLIGLDVANIDGFVHLTRIGAIGLQIREMLNIVNLAGLRSLTAVGGNVTVVDNPSLPQCVVDNELDEVAITGTVTTSGNTGAGDCT